MKESKRRKKKQEQEITTREPYDLYIKKRVMDIESVYIEKK